MNRITWKPGRYGSITGHVGTAEEYLFCIDSPHLNAGEWVLDTMLPVRLRVTSSSQDVLKGAAEACLTEFAVSLGAVFPESTPGSPDGPYSSEEGSGDG
jgi:hypothetical protein